MQDGLTRQSRSRIGLFKADTEAQVSEMRLKVLESKMAVSMGVDCACVPMALRVCMSAWHVCLLARLLFDFSKYPHTTASLLVSCVRLQNANYGACFVN